MANPIILSEITTADEAASLFTNRRTAGAKINRQFYDGDHYQGSMGYMGQLPPAGVSYRAQTILEIEAGFISENVIREMVDRHVAGNLGRECIWGFLPADIPTQNSTRIRKLFSKLVNAVLPNQSTTQEGTDPNVQAADEATTLWWDKRRIRNNLKDALRGALLDDPVCLNFFFPPGVRDVNGAIPTAKDLASGLMIPRLRVLPSDKAGIFTDEDTEEEFGVYSYTNRDDKKCAEITYIQNGQTILTVLVEKRRRDFVYELGGRLLMYELRREPLITEQIRSNQKALNLDLTSMMRNVNLAGNLERTVFNAERPKKTVRVNDESAQGWHEELRDADYETGAGATMFLAGLLIRDDNGVVIGRANPNVSFRQPVDVETFIKTRADLREAMHGQAQQLHIMISGDATVSGKSREQARAEYKSSLMISKEVIDDCGRWVMETGARLGAQLCGQTAKFINLRAEFNSIIDDGPVNVLDRQENRKDVEAGLLSVETAMSRNQVEDTDAELERIQTEQEEKPEPITPPLNPKPVNGDSEVVQ